MGRYVYFGGGGVPVVSAPPDGDLNNGVDYRLGTVSDFDISIPDPVPDNFEVAIAFTSGSAAASVSYPDSIKWSGTDVWEGVFVPVSNTRYNVAIWFDGEFVNAVVRGVGI